jgi:hypothetical protein
LAVGGDGLVYVTGFGAREFFNGVTPADYGTAKLSPEGSNVWVRMTDVYNSSWWDRSDKVAVDDSGNVYVAGCTVWGCGSSRILTCYRKYGFVKYDPQGNRLWTTGVPGGAGSLNVEEVVAFAVSGGHVYFTAIGDSGSFYTGQLRGDGTPEWAQRMLNAGGGGVSAMAVNRSGEILLAGTDIVDAGWHTSFITFKANGAGNVVWQASYSGGVVGYHQSVAMALDDAGNTYVTGWLDQSPTNSDWATIKYSPAGVQQWVQQYDGPAHRVDEARAIAVDASGAVYVAGTQTTTNGSIETVLIKYADLTNIELLPGGTAVLHFVGTAGAPCRLQASTDLADWSDVRNGVVGSDGIARFEDTNAPASLTRFYRMVSP